MTNKDQERNIKSNQRLVLSGYFNKNNEVWKLVCKLHNLYAVSNTGKVMSMRTGNLMKVSTKSDGYKLLVASINGNKKGIYVHRLVAEEFLPNPNNLPVVNHKDENPANNDVSNLEWCTWRYNNTYNGIHRRKRYNHTAWNKGKSMKNDPIIMMIKDDNIQYFSCIIKAAEYISKEKNIGLYVAYSHIYKALKVNKSNSCYGYNWEYAS